MAAPSGAGGVRGTAGSPHPRAMVDSGASEGGGLELESARSLPLLSVMTAHSPPSAPGSEGNRLSLMLSYGGWERQNFAEQLPRLLEPIGIECLRVGSAEEATTLLQVRPVHIAVIDLRIPLDRSADEPGGERLLKILRRLDAPPPTVVVRPRPATVRGSARGLSNALREGAYTVMDGPIKIEPMLEVLRRIVRRHYADHWSAA